MNKKFKNSLLWGFMFVLFFIQWYYYQDTIEYKIGTNLIEKFSNIKENTVTISNDSIKDLSCEKFVSSEYIFCKKYVLYGTGFDDHLSDDFIPDFGFLAFPRYHNIHTGESVLFLRTSHANFSGSIDTFSTSYLECIELWSQYNMIHTCNDKGYEVLSRLNSFSYENKHIIFLLSNFNKDYSKYFGFDIYSLEDNYSKPKFVELPMKDFFERANMDISKEFSYSVGDGLFSINNNFFLIPIYGYEGSSGVIIYSLLDSTFEIQIMDNSNDKFFWVTDAYFGYYIASIDRGRGRLGIRKRMTDEYKEFPYEFDCKYEDAFWDATQEKLLILCNKSKDSLDFEWFEYPDFIDLLNNEDGWQQNQQPE